MAAAVIAATVDDPCAVFKKAEIKNGASKPRLLRIKPRKRKKKTVKAFLMVSLFFARVQNSSDQSDPPVGGPNVP